MIYSSGVSSTYLTAKQLLTHAAPDVHVASRKIETSDPKDLDEAYLKDELGLNTVQVPEGGVGTVGVGDEKKPFARPKGPVRKR